MSIRDDMIQKVVGNPGKYSIQQLQAAVEDGTLPAYVVVPIIQDKVQQQKQMQAAMQAQQEQPPQSTIAEEIMQEAQGVEQLPSNLPEQYASGGIVAFDEGGEVERYQNRGLVASDYEQRIREEAIRQGIDPDLMVRLAGIESSFDPNAVSPKGAAGIMQLMPDTAKGLGLSETDRFDPNKAIPAGISYFKQQLERFGGDPEKAAAAYNMGPTALTRFLEQTGGVLDRRGLNPETANYLTKLFPIGAAVAGEPQPAAAPTQAPAQEGQRPRKFLGLDVVETPEQRAASEAYRAAAQQPVVDSSTPFGRGVRSVMSSFGENQTNAELQQAVAQKFGPKASVFGGFMSQSDEERQAAQKIMENVRGMPTAELRMVLQQPTAVEAVKAIGASRVPDQVERAAIARATAQARAAQPQEKAAPAAAPGAGGPRSFSEIFEGVPAPEIESPMNLYKRHVEPVGKRLEEAEKALKAETARLRGQIGGELHQELEASLRKEAEELGVDKQTARNMAIFKAGLAMMAGTSRNALENIGKGAMLGAEDWQRASSEIKKAQKENQRMLAHIESARRAEKRGDVKEQIDELQRAADRKLAMDKYLAAGAFAAGVKTEEMALDVFGKRLTSATSQFGAQEKGETSLLAAMLRGAGKEGMSEAQTTNLRGDIIQDMEFKGFTLQAYRAALNNPSLTQAQADQIAADPKNARVVQQVEQARRAEIERRLRERRGIYPETPTAQTATGTAPQIKYLGTQ